MPFTSQRGNEPDMSSVEANASERQNIPDSSAQASNGDAETSRRRADAEAGAPSSKRQKKD